MPETSPTWWVLPDRVHRAGNPIIVFNKSHSGSRLLAELLFEAGVYLGSHINESYDSEDLLRLVEYLVTRYYPDYGPLWKTDCDDSDLSELIQDVFSDHLSRHESPESRWGWKLCETTYILPVLDRLFPNARYVHIIRDGRDVAFSDHVGPRDAFWKKIYFNTDGITHWRGRRLTDASYRRRSHVYNAVHWVNSVTIGRAYGSMLKERYMEVRYEELCNNFVPTATRIFTELGIAVDSEFLQEFSRRVHTKSIGKYRNQPRFRQKRVVGIIKPLLLSLGYR